MIHLALVILAIVVIGWFALQLIGFVMAAFDDGGGGCGCLSMILVGIVLLIIVACFL